MPFTLAHPAIVLPLKYIYPRYFSLTGLIIGSILPDFEYFMRMQLQSNHSHSLWGILYFDLPIGILLAFVYHIIIRNSLINNLPAFLYNRWSYCKTNNWYNYFRQHFCIVIASLLIGIVSHIGWDSLTHPDGFLVRNIEFLSMPIHIAGKKLIICKILQHASTLGGFVVIGLFIWKMPHTQNRKHSADIRYWILFTFVASIIVSARLLYKPTLQPGNLIVICIASSILSITATSFVWNRWLRSLPKEEMKE